MTALSYNIQRVEAMENLIKSLRIENDLLRFENAKLEILIKK